ncbi:MAG: glycosyltransferase family 2 protein [Chryseolinea sp.]
MMRISAVIITYNEENHISRCLDSLKSIADEIVVVDSFSKDKTKEICLSMGVCFFENPFEGFTAQKNHAMKLATFDYILSLDADEYLSDELKESIQNVKENGANVHGYTMNRLNRYRDKWIKTCGWYPDRKIRFWDRRQGEWHGGKVHEIVKLQPSAQSAHLEGDLLHISYENVSQFIKKIQEYSEIYAQDNAHKKKSSVFKIIYKTIFSFMKAYFIKGGILDGYEGLLISGSIAIGVFYKYSKLLEANRSFKH